MDAEALAASAIPCPTEIDLSRVSFEATRSPEHAKRLLAGMEEEEEEEEESRSLMGFERMKEVLALHAAYIPNVSASEMLGSGEYESIAMVDASGKAAIGCCTYRAHSGNGPSFLELSLFCVDVACQGRGLGQQLMRALERVAQEKHDSSLILAYADNSAFPFFRRMGFTRTVSNPNWKPKVICYNDAVVVEKVIGAETRPKPIRVVQCTSGRPRCYCRSGRTRAIERYDPVTGETLEVYCSASDASRKLGLAACSVTHVTNGHAHSAKGHVFRYVEDLPFLTGGARPVARVNVVDDEVRVLREYSSARNAARKIFGEKSTMNGLIGECCNGFVDEVAGLVFRWADERIRPCWICRSSCDADALLLCDGMAGRCWSTAHIHCLGLEKVPDGDWYCESCEARRAAGYDMRKAVPLGLPRFFSEETLAKRRRALGLITENVNSVPSSSSASEEEEEGTPVLQLADKRVAASSSLEEEKEEADRPEPTTTTTTTTTKEVSPAAADDDDDAPPRKKHKPSRPTAPLGDEDARCIKNEDVPDDVPAEEEPAANEVEVAEVKMVEVAPLPPPEEVAPSNDITPKKKIKKKKKKKKNTEEVASKKKKKKKITTSDEEVAAESKKTEEIAPSSTPQKKKKTEEGAEMPIFSPLTTAEESGRKIKVRLENPKRCKSKSWARYEVYKVATTTKEYFALGGTRADLAYDTAKGFVEFVADHSPKEEEEAFWRPVGSPCRISHNDMWYSGRIVGYEDAKATIAYDNYTGYATILDLKEKGRIKWSA
ncbi:hypothetical protein CTAYLR_004922 [Chrysophaeum taylorii]|uniref:PHD-type domain-containing protein n=1 Tax=Chrysophaeum taylorii TaxID=2483200 RepID=A0AAD7UPI5_9STRA|nr:hypothetical protein CTAYLR_004922 [Chrysophaeum taylorii]